MADAVPFGNYQYEIYLRGGLGEHAAIGRPLLRRVPADEAAECVERLVGAYLAERNDGETFQLYAMRKTDEEIGVITGRPVAVARGRASDDDAESD